jgi:hypothetical protein
LNPCRSGSRLEPVVNLFPVAGVDDHHVLAAAITVLQVIDQDVVKNAARLVGHQE